MAKRPTWRNRISGHGEESPAALVANPANWRQHPKNQAAALAGVLDEVGWVQDVIVNRTTGHLVDGHLRVSLAVQRKETTIPVVYVDLTPAEEALVLATIDPLSAMATTDATALDALLREVSTGEAAVQEMLAKLGSVTLPDEPAPLGAPAESRYKEQYGVIVVCDSEGQQEEIYNALQGQGYECKVVVT